MTSLYPEREPFDHSMLDVGESNTIYREYHESLRQVAAKYGVSHMTVRHRAELWLLCVGFSWLNVIAEHEKFGRATTRHGIAM